ncbi:MAG: CRISPR-associated endonuclease Cas2 [Bacteroides sp.]
MMVLITYDVETTSPTGQKRLRKVAKQCVNYGQRVQNSVFECLVNPAQFSELKQKLANIIDKDKDSIRFYFLGNNWERRIEYIGILTSYNPEAELII